MRGRHRTPRRWPTLLAWTAILFAASLTAVAVTGDRPPEDAHCVNVEELEVYVCGTTTSTPTTSTSTSSTSSTTTTTAPTTTTTAPTTTTTPQGLVIPATLEQTIPGFNVNESYRFQTACVDIEDDPRTVEDESFTCVVYQDGSRIHVSQIDYLAHGMPYLYSEAQPGNHDHAWWVPGDREGYKCGYGFMYDKHPAPFGESVVREPGEGKFIARFTIVRAFGYGKVLDAYMEEGQRYYDGKLADEGGNELQDPNEASDCVAESGVLDFDYDSYVPHGPDDIRVGLFRADGEIADIRDFTNLDPQGGHFEFVTLEDGRAQIVFVNHQNMKVSHAFYYDVLADGRIAVEVNGVTIQD